MADMAGFAHAADNDAAMGGVHHGDGGGEGAAKPVPDRSTERREAACLGLQRAQGAGDQRLVAFAHRLVWASQFRLRHGAVVTVKPPGCGAQPV